MSFLTVKQSPYCASFMLCMYIHVCVAIHIHLATWAQSKKMRRCPTNGYHVFRWVGGKKRSQGEKKVQVGEVRYTVKKKSIALKKAYITFV